MTSRAALWAMSLRERLDMQTDKSASQSGCWLWTGASSPRYGIVRHRGRRLTTHRAAWEAINGPIPAGLQICHKCDVPRCVNPDHLFLGTNADNVADMVAKGRSAIHGERHWKAKLTPEQVRQIRADGRSQNALAAAYGVSQFNIHAIKTRKSWRDLV